MLLSGLAGAVGGLVLFVVSTLMLTIPGPGPGTVTAAMLLLTVAVLLLAMASSVLTGLRFGQAAATHVVTAGLWFALGASTLAVVTVGLLRCAGPCSRLWVLTAVLPLAAVGVLTFTAVLALRLLRSPSEPAG
jgi:hypothetical protein